MGCGEWTLKSQNLKITELHPVRALGHVDWCLPLIDSLCAVDKELSTCEGTEKDMISPG